MGWLKKTKEEGLSLRMTFFIMLIIFLALTTALLTMSYHTIRSFRDLSAVTDTYIELQDAAASLMSASDYLTEEAQRYTVMGEREDLDNYLTEAKVTCRREKAVEAMEKAMPDSPALTELREAMHNSVALMNIEYKAMRLTLDAQGDADIPEELRDVILTEEEQALSAEEKRTLAMQMMHDDTYYTGKNQIRSDFNSCTDALKEVTADKQSDMKKHTMHDLTWTVILIIIQSAGLILMLVLTTRLGINPLLSAVDHIKHDRELPIVGAHEFRYLAGTYNKMYAAYKRSIEHLSYKASHDKLTGLFNRAGFDLICQGVDPAATAVLLFDADNFKTINDTCGHEKGDLVLMQIASALKQHFRSDDYISRLGGDEFVALMVHISGDCRHMIEEKVKQINRDLAASVIEGLPATSLSAGVSFCSDSGSVKEALHEADAAMYRIKKSGGNGCCFYESGMEMRNRTL